MTETLAAPFGQITFEDLRVVRLCGSQWAALGPMPVADAVAASHTLDTQSVLAQAIPALNDWAQQTAVATLDQLAQDLFTAWEHSRMPIGRTRSLCSPADAVTSPPLDPAARRAVMARLGLHGNPPMTLQQAGNLAGLTRERIRQLATQIEAAAGRRVWAPTLDQAIDLADATLTSSEYTQLLHHKGLTRRPWHPASVQSLARLCGRPGTLPLAQPANESEALWVTMAVRRAATTLIQQRYLSPIAQIAVAASDPALNRTVTVEQARAALQTSDRHLLAGQWVGPRAHGQPGGRLPHIALRLVALGHYTGGIITTGHIRHGMQRRSRHGGSHQIPPIEAIAAYLHAHPDFALADNPDPAQAAVSLQTTPPGLQELFGQAATVLIDIIGSHPHRLVARHHLLQQAQQAGISAHAIRQVLSYHEAFTRHSNSLWTLTGTTINPSAASAARATLPPKRRPREGITPDGHPWWTATITRQWRRHKVVERYSMTRYPGRYQTITPDGIHSDALTITPAGALRGLHHHVNRHTLPDGTTIQITINPRAKTATIQHATESTTRSGITTI